MVVVSSVEVVELGGSTKLSVVSGLAGGALLLLGELGALGL